MEFIANFWWLWLSLFIISGGYAIYNQYRRIKSMATVADSIVSGLLVGMSNPEATYESAKKVARAVENFWTNIVAMAVAVAVSILAAILLFLAIIINLVKYLS